MNSKKKARVIAYYLPQYHPIPENDKYWGKGFTEWTNVTKAKPLFPGHYQPKLPADLGFYDLRLPIIREQQAELARHAGIEGFCYWHYWFGGGKMVLNEILEDVLQTGTPDFPFCFGWANHSWSNKTWTKGKVFKNDTMIFEQTYPGEQDYLDHFNYCLPFFKDNRYIKVDGKPLFVIYSPSNMPDVDKFIAKWRELAFKNGLNGIHFVGLRLTRKCLSEESLLAKGFDAINNSNLNMWKAECNTMHGELIKRALTFLSMKFNMPFQLYNYKHIIKWLCNDHDYKENIYPTILPGYDRTARSGNKAQIYYNNKPQYFAKHVDDVLEHTKFKDYEHRIVFLKSWNEWGEGNYIEPDQKYGRKFLDILKDKVLG